MRTVRDASGSRFVLLSVRLYPPNQRATIDATDPQRAYAGAHRKSRNFNYLVPTRLQRRKYLRYRTYMKECTVRNFPRYDRTSFGAETTDRRPGIAFLSRLNGVAVKKTNLARE